MEFGIIIFSNNSKSLLFPFEKKFFADIFGLYGAIVKTTFYGDFYFKLHFKNMYFRGN